MFDALHQFLVETYDAAISRDKDEQMRGAQESDLKLACFGTHEFNDGAPIRRPLNSEDAI